jgi:hypothetical protein
VKHADYRKHERGIFAGDGDRITDQSERDKDLSAPGRDGPRHDYNWFEATMKATGGSAKVRIVALAFRSHDESIPLAPLIAPR